MTEHHEDVQYELQRDGEDLLVRRVDTGEEFRLRPMGTSGVAAIREGTLQRPEAKAVAVSETDCVADEAAAWFSCAWEAVMEAEGRCFLTMGDALIETETQTLCAFLPNSQATVFRLPPEIRTVGDFAFCACARLKQVVLSEGVEQIGDGAFEHCAGLTDVYIPSTVRHIGRGVFDGCGQVKAWVHEACYGAIWGYFREETGLDFEIVCEEPEHLGTIGES